MTFQEYWKNLPRGGKQKLADACGYSRSHLSRVACGKLRCSAELALRIEKFTYGNVKRRDVAPHVEW